jgi:hypothetical protein
MTHRGCGGYESCTEYRCTRGEKGVWAGDCAGDLMGSGGMRDPPCIYCYVGTLVQINRKPCKDGDLARTRIRTAAFRLRYNTTDHGVPLPSSSELRGKNSKTHQPSVYCSWQERRVVCLGADPQASISRLAGRSPGTFLVGVRGFEGGGLVHAARVRYCKKRMNIRTQILRSISPTR